MNRNIHRLICIVCFCAATATANPLLTLPQELIGRHHGAMGQHGQATKDKPLSFGEDDTTLGGIELKADGRLVVPFALKGELFKELSFKFHENAVSGAVAVWHPLQVGNDRYSATLIRYGSVFRVLVKLQREDGSVEAIQWICAEPRKAQAGNDQPATGEVDKQPPESAARFLESIKTGIQKDFVLNVLYYETGVEELHWSLLRNAPAKKEGANVSKTISGQAVVISESDVKQMVDYLVKAQAFLREPYCGEGTPHQGWTISLHNGESNLRWYLGKDRRAMDQAKDLIGLETILEGEAKELWIAIAAHAKK